MLVFFGFGLAYEGFGFEFKLEPKPKLADGRPHLLLMLVALMAQVHDEWAHLVTSYPNKF